MTEKKKSWTVREIMDAVDRSSPADFDGHVDFAGLSFEQQLLWISRSARMALKQAGPTVRERRNKPRTA